MQQWNAMFSIGGPACLITTIEGNTGLRMDHFAVVDFRGFRDMVDALGGVPICAPKAIDDPKAKLGASAGRHVLDGTQALGYVRARKTFGDGSDLGRIGRQQAFLSSVVQEATRTSLLVRPDKLFGFLDAATRSTTDEQFDLGTMKDLASSVKDIGVKNIQFITVPVQEYPADPNRVEWAPSADALWQILRDDGVVGEKPTTTASGIAAPLAVSPTEIAVESSTPPGCRASRHRWPRRWRCRASRPTPSSHRAARTAWSSSTAPVEGGRSHRGRGLRGRELREYADVTSGVRVVLGAGAAAVQEIPNRTGSSPVPTPTVSARARTDPDDHGPHGRPGHLLLPSGRLGRRRRRAPRVVRSSALPCDRARRRACDPPPCATLEASPSPVYGAALLMGLGSSPSRVQIPHASDSHRVTSPPASGGSPVRAGRPGAAAGCAGPRPCAP